MEKLDNEYINLCNEFLKFNNISNILTLPYNSVSIEEICSEMNQRFYNWLASFHYLIEKQIENIFSSFIKPNSEVIYSGGGAQNTVFNEKLSKKYNLIIPPHCYDGGISIGCVKFAALLNNIKIYIEDYPFSSGVNDVGYAKLDTIYRVAQLLKEGKIIGWCQGRSEVGPRALGHRSILMNPSLKNGKDILNSRVKKRESWRPFAASILEEDAINVIGRDKTYRYMLNAVTVKPEYRDVLSSVVHIDNTCRFQTVNNINPLKTFYLLLKEFKRITGIPGILNTSFNLASKPIVDSYDSIINAFEEMDLDALCVGNKLLVK